MKMVLMHLIECVYAVWKYVLCLLTLFDHYLIVHFKQHVN